MSLSARRCGPSDSATIGELAGITFPVGKGALYGRSNLSGRRRAMNQHSLQEPALRRNQAVIEKDVKLTEPAFFDRHLRPKAVPQLLRELFGATVIAARLAVQNP